MDSVIQRAEGIFDRLGLATASIEASGRYQRSEYIRPGVTYWSTSSDRHKTDIFGVQFTSDGLKRLALVEPQFQQHGYDVRNPGTDKVTFCKSVPRGPGGALDVVALKRIKAEIDAILNAPVGVEGEQAPASDFLSFMQASPLAGVELDLADRRSDTPREAF